MTLKKINRSRHFVNLTTYFSFIKLEEILRKQEVDHLNECQGDCFTRKPGMEPVSSHLPASPGPGPDQRERTANAIKRCSRCGEKGEKKRMKKKVREGRGEARGWNEG